jgi:tRNA-specific 2-thiouridylase
MRFMQHPYQMACIAERADALGCDFIATGHYASVHQHTNGRYFISKGLDETKDQSYVLWGLEQTS